MSKGGVFGILQKSYIKKRLAPWTVETELPADMRARFRYIAQLIEEFRLERVREPHVKHPRGPLGGMRMKGWDGISRALYVTVGGRRVVVVRVFIKKTEKTPKAEIELALKRAKEIPQ